MILELTVRDRFRGVILGTAVGDSIGLPAEGISRQRARKLFPGRWRHRLVIKWGMVSDDTDHTVFVAQSLLAHPHSSELFAKRLSWCLRWWLLSAPASIGRKPRFLQEMQKARLTFGARNTFHGMHHTGHQLFEGKGSPYANGHDRLQCPTLQQTSPDKISVLPAIRPGAIGPLPSPGSFVDTG